MAWFDALPLDELAAKGKTVVRHEGRQILLLHTERGVFACANRCPHEGYPLSEGSLGRWLCADLQLAQLEIRPDIRRDPGRWRPTAALSGSPGGRSRLARRLAAGPGVATAVGAPRHRQGAGGWRPATPGTRDRAAGAPRNGSGRGRRHRRFMGCRAAGIRHHARHRRSAGLAAPVLATRHRRCPEDCRGRRNPRPHRR